MADKGLSLPKLAAKVPTEAAAYEYLEHLRWGEDRQVCPHCGCIGGHYFLKPKNGGRKTRTGKVSERRVWKCKDCRKQFTVLVGTIFHGTKIPVRAWVLLTFDLMSAKNGMSAREVARKYDLSDEAAWFACHRLREAMRRDPLAGLLTGTVIADETFLGPNPRNFKKGKRFQANHYKKDHKIPVLALVHPESGEVRSRVIPDVKGETLRAALAEQVIPAETDLQTDHHQPYIPVGWKYRSHGRVNHAEGEYVKDGVTTNPAEGYFGQLKRSLDGTFHHVSREHLDRYLAEFDYRYTTRKMGDAQRMARLMGQVHGRRLSYKPLTGRG